MTEQQLQELEALEGMFQTLGWKVLCSHIEGYKAAIADQWRTIKPEDLRFLQGRYDGLCQIAGQEAMFSLIRKEHEQPVLADISSEAYD